MRTSIMLATALAATALAKPVEKRSEVVVTTVDVVYTTAIVTVTAGQSAAATGKTSSARKHHHRPSKQPSLSSYPAPATSSQAPPPVQTTSQAPAPVPTSSEAPAPAPSSYSPPAQSSSAAPAPEPTSSNGLTTDYQKATVDHHNYHRANHSAPNIAWDQGLADTAMKIAKTCVYGHSMQVDGGGYGQNIAAGIPAGDIGSTISDAFYNGEVTKFSGYGQANPDTNGFEGWGHFSQIVWKSTTKVGCATYDCHSSLSGFGSPNEPPPTNGYFTVCNYSPPGNYGGEYGANIGASLHKATVLGSFGVNAKSIDQNYCSATGQTSRYA